MKHEEKSKSWFILFTINQKSCISTKNNADYDSIKKGNLRGDCLVFWSSEP